MLKTYLFRIGTPLTVGLFLVSAVSGAALYFGWAPGMFHQMHEVLSMVLLAPFVVHVWRNWRPLVGYFRKAAMPVALALSLAGATWFAVGSLGNSTGRGGNPAMALFKAAQTAPISALAPVLKLDAPTVVSRLNDAGFGPVAAEDTIGDIAGRTGHNALEVLASMTTSAAPTE